MRKLLAALALAVASGLWRRTARGGSRVIGEPDNPARMHTLVPDKRTAA